MEERWTRSSLGWRTTPQNLEVSSGESSSFPNRAMLTNRNFTKFLVDKEGKVVGRYGPQKTPEQLIPEIEKLL
jgi:glutathione peroxidase-family protein